MEKTTMIWLIAAASLVVVGLIIFAAVMTVYGWNFNRLDTGKYETNTYEINEKFSNISIKTDTADIVFLPSDKGKCSVVCYEKINVRHTVSVTDDTLIIDAVDTRKWYEYVGINSKSPKITVYLPESEYAALVIKESTDDIEIPDSFKFESIDVSVSTGNVRCYASATETVKIAVSTGNVSVADISTGRLELSASTGNVTVTGVSCREDVKIGVTTGKVELTDIVCQSFTSNGTTGDISLNNVIAVGSLSIERGTGNVHFRGADAADIFVRTETGDVEGSILTDKVFVAKTNAGRVKVPDSSTGGRCEITTYTGNIIITVD